MLDITNKVVFNQKGSTVAMVCLQVHLSNMDIFQTKQNNPKNRLHLLNDFFEKENQPMTFSIWTSTSDLLSLTKELVPSFTHVIFNGFYH